MSSQKKHSSWRLGSLLAAALFLNFGASACVDDSTSVDSFDDKSDVLNDNRSNSIYIHYDYAYVEVKLTGTEGQVELWDTITQGCKRDVHMPLGNGDVNDPLKALAWRGGARIRVTSTESTGIEISQRPIPGCGKDKGHEEPTEADLQACLDVKAMIAEAKERAVSVSCG